MNEYCPASIKEACEIVRAARSGNRSLRIAGGDTRAQLGRPVDSADVLLTRKLDGIVIYEPAEMVLRAKAGTPLETIEAVLDANSQMLPFEPMDHCSLYGSNGAPTIGALAACNISGPRRIRAGAARDALIGVRFVNGAGEDLSSGGRVMKNVTGLDLVKLQCGAHGTLGLLTEVTFKLLPKPECTGTLVLDNLGEADAIRAMSLALQSPFEVSGAAHVFADGNARTAIRVEHFKPSVEYRLNELATRLSSFGASHVMKDDESRTFWRMVRDVEPLVQPAIDAVWRISIKASAAVNFLQALRAAGLAFRSVLDHGGGLIWLATAPGDDAGAHVIRSALPAGSGHAMLVRAPDTIRRKVPVFQPLPDPVMKLSAGIKASIDAGSVFNPGRMYAGI